VQQTAQLVGLVKRAATGSPAFDMRLLSASFPVQEKRIAHSHVQDLQDHLPVPLQSLPQQRVVRQQLVKTIDSTHVSVVVQDAVGLCDLFTTSVLPAAASKSSSMSCGRQNVSFVLPLLDDYAAMSASNRFSFVELASHDSFRQVLAVSSQRSTQVSSCFASGTDL